MTFDRTADVLTIGADATITMAADGGADDATEIRSGSAVIARRSRYIEFIGGLESRRAGQIITADAGFARLAPEEDRVERVELRGNAAIRAEAPAEGGLRELTGQDMDLGYGEDGRTLQHVVVLGKATIELAGRA